MKNQEVLINQIRKQLSEKDSLNDVIASVLNISYDAAHRRVSGKSKFSINEAVQLASHFNISLDGLFFQKDKIIVEKTLEINNLSDMLQYFKNSAQTIEKLSQEPGTILYYSAKDIPLFYFMEGTIMSKFKAFVWLKLLNSEFKDLHFENFVIDEAFLDTMQKLQTSYYKVDTKEIWNDTTINSSLQQILYFYESDQLTFNTAKALFSDLRRILNNIKKKTNSPNSKFQLYYNELILLNNNLLFQSKNQLTMFVPYTLLGYFVTNNKPSCNNVQQWFEQQIVNSKPLNSSGIKEQNQFFSKANRKIDFYVQQLNREVGIDI